MRPSKWMSPVPAQTRSVARRSGVGGPQGIMYWLGIPMALFLLLPVATLLGRSVLGGAPLSPLPATQIWTALGLSFRTSGTATVLAVLMGTPLAYMLAKGYLPLWWERSLMVLVEIPLILPPVVAGLALLLLLGRFGWLGRVLYEAGIAIAFTGTAVVLAQLFVASPLYIRSAVLGLEQVDSEIENASALDGASFWQTLVHISLPLSRSALLTGMVMTWARALGEFGAALIFAGNYPGRTQTMPVVIYLGFEMDLSVSLVLAGILLVVALGVLVLMHMVQNRWL